MDYDFVHLMLADHNRLDLPMGWLITLQSRFDPPGPASQL